MNYQNIYESLIAKRQKNPATGYTERHHILPKSLGGSDDPSNLVVLSGREHWVAHLLLYKIHKNSQMLFACNMMAMKCEERGIAYIKSSRLYEAIRIEHSKRIGQWTSKKGKANSQYGTMWICNIELEENKKISKDSDIPEGWIKGRNKWKPKWKPERQKNMLRTCKWCGKKYNLFNIHNECQTHQKQLKSLIKFGFDKNVIGTPDAEEEYNRCVSFIKKEYESGKSLTVLCKEYGYPDAGTLGAFLKNSLKIKLRSKNKFSKRGLAEK